MKLRTLILTTALLLGGCCSPAAIQAMKDGMSANKGHMNDASLPVQAREIATDNYDLMAQTLYNMDGTAIPADTAERMAARNPSNGE